MFMICNVLFLISLWLPIAGRPSALQHSNVFLSHMEMPWSINFYGAVLVFHLGHTCNFNDVSLRSRLLFHSIQHILLNGCLRRRREARKLPSGSTSPHLAGLPTFHMHICKTKERSNNIVSRCCTSLPPNSCQTEESRMQVKILWAFVFTKHSHAFVGEPAQTWRQTDGCLLFEAHKIPSHISIAVGG